MAVLVFLYPTGPLQHLQGILGITPEAEVVVHTLHLRVPKAQAA